MLMGFINQLLLGGHPLTNELVGCFHGFCKATNILGGHHLVICYSLRQKMAIDIVDLPINHCPLNMVDLSIVM